MARVKICSPRSLLPNICNIQIGTNSISSNLNSWHICMKVQEYVTEVLPSAHYVQIPRESQNTSHDISSLLVHFMIPLSLLGNNPGPGNFVKIRWVCTRTCAPKFHVMADPKWGPVISSRHLAELSWHLLTEEHISEHPASQKLLSLTIQDIYEQVSNVLLAWDEVNNGFSHCNSIMDYIVADCILFFLVLTQTSSY